MFMGCESFGVFKHEHKDKGVCATYREFVSETVPEKFVCFTKYSEQDCLKEINEDEDNDYWATSWFSDMSCEDFCDRVNVTCDLVNDNR